jgi:osmotically-inducible protein OsmY
MTQTALISEMQKFHFGGKIFCSDGEYGTLAQVGFDAETLRMTVIVLKQGSLFKKVYYLPFSVVTNADSDGITLNLARADVMAASKPELVGVLLDNKSAVEVQGTGEHGTLQLIAVHPEDGSLAYIVAHNLRDGQDMLIQREFVAALATGRVMLSLPAGALQKMLPYRSDAELQREVERILFDLTPLHVDIPGMKVRVQDSVLYLGGNISSSLRGDIVVDQASGVPGLLEIKNSLIGDDALAADLAMALGHDKRTRDLPIGVYPRLGVVRLSGAVHTEQQKAAAGEIASSFPGVRSVINDIVVDPKADILRVMSSSEGGEASDKVPGGRYVRHTK